MDQSGGSPQRGQSFREPVASTDERRANFSSRSFVRYGSVKVSLSSQSSRSSTSPSITRASSSSDQQYDNPDSPIARLCGFPVSDNPLLSSHEYAFLTAMRLPASNNYKIHQVLHAADALNHVRAGRADRNSDLAKLLLETCALGKENPLWMSLLAMQATPLQATRDLFRIKDVQSHPLVTSLPLRFSYGALAGQSWSLQEIAKLPTEQYMQCFSNVCLVYHATLQDWYREMCTTTSACKQTQLQEQIAVLVMEHRALCFALTFLDFTAASVLHTWPKLPDNFTLTVSQWSYVMDKVGLKPDQLVRIRGWRAEALSQELSVDIGSGMIYDEFVTLLGTSEGCSTATTPTEVLERVEAFHQSQLQRKAIQVLVANSLLFEIFTPLQTGIFVSAVQVDVVCKPVYAWMDWINLIYRGVVCEESGWMHTFTPAVPPL